MKIKKGLIKSNLFLIFTSFSVILSFMDNLDRYNHLNKYLKNKFGERTLKICVDGGFTCPNRDGTLSKIGCIFCSEQGSGEHLKNTLPIPEQINSFLNSYRGQRAN